MSSSLIEFSKNKITTFIDFLENKYTEFKDTEFFGISIDNGIDIISDINNIANLLKSICSKYQEITFSKFMKGISSQINSNNKLSDEEKEKLDQYLSKEDNIHFIFNTIRKSLSTNSLKCTELLAMIIGSIIHNQKEINVIDYTMIEALSSMNDFDLKSFFQTYSYINDNFPKEKNITLKDLLEHISNEEFELSLNKLISYQLLDKKYKSVEQGLLFDGKKAGKPMENDEIFIFLNKVSSALFEMLTLTNWF